MADSGKPLKSANHIQTCHFNLQSWVEQDLIQLECVPTNNNSSDALIKDTSRVRFN